MARAFPKISKYSSFSIVYLNDDDIPDYLLRKLSKYGKYKEEYLDIFINGERSKEYRVLTFEEFNNSTLFCYENGSLLYLESFRNRKLQYSSEDLIEILFSNISTSASENTFSIVDSTLVL